MPRIRFTVDATLAAAIVAPVERDRTFTVPDLYGAALSASAAPVVRPKEMT